MVESFWSINEHEETLAHEIYAVLRERELLTPKYMATSLQLHLRRYLVDWLAVISEKLHLTHGILHLSVTLLDLLMEKFEFPKKMQLNLLALCSLWVAAKLDERDDLIPKVATLQGFLVNSQYLHDDFIQMELTIMNCLDWRLLVPTPVQFLDFYIKDIVSDEDLHVGYKITAVERAKTYVLKYAHYFLGVVIQDHTFHEYLPSQVAAAVLCASRTCLKIAPSWASNMTKLSGYTVDDLQSCVEKLMKYHEDDQRRCQPSDS